MNIYPTLSIITCTLNAELNMFKKSLESISIQQYDKKKIEHLVIDGGSTNGTQYLAKKYSCKIIQKTELKTQEQVRQSIGFTQAKNSILLILQSDNILTSKHWLKQMVEPFIYNKNVFCTFSAYYSYKKNMSALTRYTAFFGSPEPTLYYLRKSEKIPLTQKEYNKGELITETSHYYIVRFTTEDLPTCGDNGHMVLRKSMSIVNKDPYSYTHLDAINNLVERGYTTFGVVKNSIIHVANPSILMTVKRKISLKEEFYDKRRGKRTYLVFNPQSGKDKINITLYIIYSLTGVIPFLESVMGFIKVHDRAWFLHPIMCFFMVVAYGYSEIFYLYKSLIKKRV